MDVNNTFYRSIVNYFSYKNNYIKSLRDYMIPLGKRIIVNIEYIHFCYYITDSNIDMHNNRYDSCKFMMVITDIDFKDMRKCFTTYGLVRPEYENYIDVIYEDEIYLNFIKGVQFIEHDYVFHYPMDISYGRNDVKFVFFMYNGDVKVEGDLIVKYKSSENINDELIKNISIEDA